MPIVDEEYMIEAGDFAQAGEGSIQIRSILKSLDIEPDIMQRAAVCAYEAEMNMVMHGGNGSLSLIVDDAGLIIEARDEGQGIGDIEQALKEGYSTAEDRHREMGFGAGMGLPNISKNADFLEIYSKPGKGTYLVMCFWFSEKKSDESE